MLNQVYRAAVVSAIVGPVSIRDSAGSFMRLKCQMFRFDPTPKFHSQVPAPKFHISRQFWILAIHAGPLLRTNEAIEFVEQFRCCV